MNLSRLSAINAQENVIRRELSKALNMTEQELIRLFDEAATRTLASDNDVFEKAGYNPTSLAENAYLQQLISAGMKKTFDSFSNLTR